MNTFRSFLVFFTAFTAVAFLSGCGGEARLDTGEALYAEYCQACHGAGGTGDGKLAYLLYPKPRDLTSGLYKLRSTRDGQLPSDGDLFSTIRAGMQGTSMPSFAFLGDENIGLIVDHIKEFDTGFESEPREAIVVPPALASSPRLLSIGEKAYTDLGCHRCHGDTGTGDGPSAGDLKDAWGYPIYVRDFTRGYYVGGYEPEDLYLRFVAGMSGTPMPSYESSLGFLAADDSELQEVLWGLIHYVKELESDEARALRVDPPADGIISSKKVENDYAPDRLLDPHAPHWKDASLYTVPVSRIWQTVHDDASAVSVRSVHTDSHLAVLLEWRDTNKDASAARVQDFQDAAAIQFSLSDSPGFHGMGSRERPVDMWFWRASRQIAMDSEDADGFRQAYGRRASDADVEDFPELIGEERFLAGRNAGNPLSEYPSDTPVEGMSAVGPETSTARPAEDQDVRGKGLWDGDVWRVAFVRELNTGAANSVQFDGGTGGWISFAVWDGAAGDRDGLKKVSTWYRLKFE